MANWALVFVYTDKSAEWLRERGYRRPAVRSGNEMPTTADMKWALKAFENLIFDVPSGEEELYGTDERTGYGFSIDGFDWDEDRTIPGDSFSIRGSHTLLPVLIKLCERCGQLYLHTEGDEPAIILDASLDAEEVLDLWREAEENGPDWGYFYDQLYGG